MTRRLLMLALLLFLPAALVRPAHAGPAGPTPEQVARFVKGAVVVPTQWDGIYTSVDSVYTCGGALQHVSTSTDTICGGKDYSPGLQTAAIDIVCTGSATATSFDMTCSGTASVFTDCDAQYSIVAHGTLSGGTSHTVSTTTITYVGTGTGCDLIPSSCTQSDNWGTRTGPAPAAYCATPALNSTWGELKTRYR